MQGPAINQEQHQLHHPSYIIQQQQQLYAGQHYLQSFIARPQHFWHLRPSGRYHSLHSNFNKELFKILLQNVVKKLLEILRLIPLFSDDEATQEKEI